MLTKEAIREVALNAGADLCGFGDMARFEGAPPEMDPRQLYPTAKTAICMAFRIPRGVQRGIEEGTQFYQYPSLAYGGINEIFAPSVLYEAGKFIEDHGYEAMINRNNGGRGRLSDMTGDAAFTISPEEIHGDVYKRSSRRTSHYHSIHYTRPVAEGRAAPEVQIQFRIVAVACGIGEIGWSKMLLTPEFGPMQRVAFIFTDAPLEPDPMYDGEPLCKRCMACFRECPGGCISRDESVKITVGGKVLEWGKLDEWRCYIHYTYPGKAHDPFAPTAAFEEHKDGKMRIYEHKGIKATQQKALDVYSVLDPYFPTLIGYNMAKCAGCLGACVNMLEKNGCLKGRFKEPFRTGKRRWQIER
jgi:epoxyqueuosine reductase